MARTPLPSDTIQRAVSFTAVNQAHLEVVAERMRRAVSDAANAELEFLRTWGLTPSRTRRFEAAAATRKMEVADYVKELIREAARQLPSKTGTAERSPKDDENRRTTMNFTGPNGAFVLNECVSSGREFNSVINARLDFARTYGLHLDLLAALDAAAEAAGETRRDVVLNILRNAAEALPPVDEKPQRSRKK